MGRQVLYHEHHLGSPSGWDQISGGFLKDLRAELGLEGNARWLTHGEGPFRRRLSNSFV